MHGEKFKILLNLN